MDKPVIYKELLKMQALHTPTGKLYDIGGYRLHIQIEGEGRPAVVFDSGLVGNSLVWTNTIRAIADFTTACAFDRAGYAWSDPAPDGTARTSMQIVDELRKLLALAGIEPPYILSGHSFGAINTLVYAKTYPGEVAGLVLIDPSHPDMFSIRQIPNPDAVQRSYGMIANLGKIGLLKFVGPLLLRMLFPNNRAFPPHTWQVLESFASRPDDYRTAQRESQSGWINFEAAHGTPGCLGDLPLEILSADWWVKGKRTPMKKGYLSLISNLATYSNRGRHTIISGCSHADLPVVRPDAVAKAVKTVIQSAKEKVRE